MYKAVLIIFVLYALSACDNKDSKSSADKNVQSISKIHPTLTLPSKKHLLIKDEIFDFDETLDSNFCNLDSLIEGDCNGGFLYFTPKGNVIFRYLCVDDTTIEYDIGHQIAQSDGILIRFFEKYTYKTEDPYAQPTAKIINAGRISEEKSEMKLIQLKNCSNAFGYITQATNNVYYLIQKSRLSFDNELMKEIATIKAMTKY